MMLLPCMHACLLHESYPLAHSTACPAHSTGPEGCFCCMLLLSSEDFGWGGSSRIGPSKVGSLAGSFLFGPWWFCTSWASTRCVACCAKFLSSCCMYTCLPACLLHASCQHSAESAHRIMSRSVSLFPSRKVPDGCLDVCVCPAGLAASPYPTPAGIGRQG